MSAQRKITVLLKAPPDKKEFVMRALRNSGIPFTFEQAPDPEAPLKLYAPEAVTVVLTLLHIIELAPKEYSGEAILQDGRNFQLDDEGRKQLREATTSAMTQQPTTGQPSYPWWMEFVPELKQIMSKLADLIEWYPRAIGKAEERITRYFIFLIAIILVATSLLTAIGKVSGEAFTFLIGALLGYLFAFVLKFLGIGGGAD